MVVVKSFGSNKVTGHYCGVKNLILDYCRNASDKITFIDIWRLFSLLKIIIEIYKNKDRIFYISLRSLSIYRYIIFNIFNICNSRRIKFYTDSILINKKICESYYFPSFIDLISDQYRTKKSTGKILIHLPGKNINGYEKKILINLINSIGNYEYIARHETGIEDINVDSRKFTSIYELLMEVDQVICFLPFRTHNYGTSNIFLQCVLNNIELIVYPLPWIKHMLKQYEIQITEIEVDKIKFIKVVNVEKIKVQRILSDFDKDCRLFASKINKK